MKTYTLEIDAAMTGEGFENVREFAHILEQRYEERGIKNISVIACTTAHNGGRGWLITETMRKCDCPINEITEQDAWSDAEQLYSENVNA